MRSADISYHLINALDKADSAHSKIKEIRSLLTEKVNAIRGDIKADARGNEIVADLLCN